MEWLIVFIVAEDLDDLVAGDHDSLRVKLKGLSEAFDSFLTKAEELVLYVHPYLKERCHRATFDHLDIH